jgi:hypothetical protein
MKKGELGQVLANIPTMVSDIAFGLMGETGKNPRFPSVFKRVKEELKYDGIDWKKLNESEKYEIEEMARDVFEGIRDAGF